MKSSVDQYLRIPNYACCALKRDHCSLFVVSVTVIGANTLYDGWDLTLIEERRWEKEKKSQIVIALVLDSIYMMNLYDEFIRWIYLCIADAFLRQHTCLDLSCIENKSNRIVFLATNTLLYCLDSLIFDRNNI